MEPSEITEKQENMPLAEGEIAPDGDTETVVKKVWLTPEMKKILVGIGGSALATFQLVMIMMFIQFFFA